ncbi:MAG: Sir2 family NAD-dependent protein deacetylase [Chloroflexota bacterium]
MFDECEIIEAIEGAASLILSAHKPSAFTGAGISQESGIPTYRRMNGSIWETVNVDDVGTAFAFYQNPQRVWDFWSEQRAIMLNAEPNHGHNSLSKIEADYTSGLPIITQNVDNLHERAGSRNVIHLHGDITKLRCSKYCKGVPSIIPFIDLDVEETSSPQ